MNMNLTTKITVIELGGVRFYFVEPLARSAVDTEAYADLLARPAVCRHPASIILTRAPSRTPLALGSQNHAGPANMLSCASRPPASTQLAHTFCPT